MHQQLTNSRMPLAPTLAIALALLPMGLGAQENGRERTGDSPVAYDGRIRISPEHGVRGDLAPILRIVSPLADSKVAPGESRIGLGSPNGSGFALNLEVITRDAVPVRLREDNAAPPENGIRHADLLNQGAINPDVPGLYVFFDCDLITPTGTVLPKFTNFASAFNVAGTDDTPGDGITAWLGWHVLESVPSEVDEFTLTAALVDEAGRIGMDRIKIKVDHSKTSGQALTPAPPAVVVGREGDPLAPDVDMIAPRSPTSLATGPQDNTLNPTNGSLMFVQVSAVAHNAEIALSETGIRDGSQNPLPAGLILDASQIPVAASGTPAGPNRNFPGLLVTFDVPLRQPNGNVVPAGVNLAPLFDVAGSEIDAQGNVRITADWVVGGALVMPQGKTSVTITSKVTDTLGRTGVATRVFPISKALSGQALTIAPR